MTKREQLLKKVKTKIANIKWTDSNLVAFAKIALDCGECPAFAACYNTRDCCKMMFDWLIAHGDEEVKNDKPRMA